MDDSIGNGIDQINSLLDTNFDIDGTIDFIDDCVNYKTTLVVDSSEIESLKRSIESLLYKIFKDFKKALHISLLDKSISAEYLLKNCLDELGKIKQNFDLSEIIRKRFLEHLNKETEFPFKPALSPLDLEHHFGVSFLYAFEYAENDWSYKDFDKNFGIDFVELETLYFMLEREILDKAKILQIEIEADDKSSKKCQTAHFKRIGNKVKHIILADIYQYFTDNIDAKSDAPKDLSQFWRNHRSDISKGTYFKRWAELKPFIYKGDYDKALLIDALHLFKDKQHPAAVRIKYDLERSKD